MVSINRFFGKAPELNGVMHWFNTKPLTMKALKGKVVLIDFWTYSCINCLRTLPHMKQLWEKYKDKGFVLIGVHTPEFEFEKDIKNIGKAIKKHGIKYPVAVDSNMAVWRAFANSYWPRQYLIDAKGSIRWDHIGEGGEAEIEENVRALLTEAGAKLPANGIKKDKKIKAPNPLARLIQTPETYVGSARNQGSGSAQYCTFENCHGYKDNGGHEPGVVYLEGEWKQEKEYAQHMSKKKGYILLPYYASEVNVVLELEENAKPAKVCVELDGKPIPKTEAGNDVRFENSKSYMIVKAPDMYRVVNSKIPAKHELKLIMDSDRLRVFAYTFG